MKLRKNRKPVETSPHSRTPHPKTAAAVVEAAAVAEGVDSKDREAVEAVEVEVPVQGTVTDVSVLFSLYFILFSTFSWKIKKIVQISSKSGCRNDRELSTFFFSKSKYSGESSHLNPER